MRILVRFEGSAAPFCAFGFGNGQGFLLFVRSFIKDVRYGKYASDRLPPTEPSGERGVSTALAAQRTCISNTYIYM